jgi:hypothetical protein
MRQAKKQTRRANSSNAAVQGGCTHKQTNTLSTGPYAWYAVSCKHMRMPAGQQHKHGAGMLPA